MKHKYCSNFACPHNHMSQETGCDDERYRDDIEKCEHIEIAEEEEDQE